jgi:hypothetical protein
MFPWNSAMASTEEIEELAATIGEVVYMEVAKWRLYLNDARLHTALAEEIAPLLEANKLDRDALVKCLQSFMVPLGSGKNLPIIDLVPDRVITQLWEILLEDDR